jgi:putative phosphoesterase
MKPLKVLVVSDSHGKANLLKQIVEREKADHVIHCGDFCTEKHELPKVNMTVVRGNCDWEKVAMEERWNGAGLRLYITHGHRYNVKATPMPLRYRGEEVGADIICFGHTHIPVAELVEGRLYLNPGSISLPIVAPVPTYAVLSIEAKRKVTVTFHQVDGRVVENMGGTFTLKK